MEDATAGQRDEALRQGGTDRAIEPEDLAGWRQAAQRTVSPARNRRMFRATMGRISRTISTATAAP